MEMIKCTSTSASLKFYMFRAISVSCLRFIFLLFQCQMWTEYQMIHFLRSSLLVFARFQCLCGFCSSSISYYLSYKVCFYQGGSSEWRCWCIERSCLSLLKAFVSWGSLFITKPLVGRDIKTGSDPGVSPLTSVNPRGQIFSNCAITISWPQGL